MSSFCPAINPGSPVFGRPPPVMTSRVAAYRMAAAEVHRRCPDKSPTAVTTMSSDGLYRNRAPPGRCHTRSPVARFSAKMLPSRVSSSPRPWVGQFGTKHLASAHRKVQRRRAPPRLAKATCPCGDSRTAPFGRCCPPDNRRRRGGSPKAIRGLREGRCVRSACPWPDRTPGRLVPSPR